MPQSNQRVGEYVLDRRIGGGTFGEVWLGRHHVWSDQLAAVKIPTDPQYLRNLQREGSAIHGLTHPNIVRAIGFDPYAPTPYLAMEYVPGTSLRPLIQTKKVPISDAVAILRQVLTGLSYAHANNIIHRDIKPENILIHEDCAKAGYAQTGLVKVTDFGLGKAATASVGSIAYSASLNDPAGREIAGSLDYMAPEQRSGGNVDARTDLYAVGVMMYELLTGEKPAGTEVPSDLNAMVPKNLDQVFRRSYARLDKRFTSADEFLHALALAPTVQGFASQPAQPTVQAVPVNVSQVQCPRCRGMIDPHDQFCMHCGVQVVADVRRCRVCGGFPHPADRFCIFCGQSLSADMAMV